jgi:5'-nucleotidase
MEQQKQIIYVDMDDVIANFTKEILRLDPSIETLCHMQPKYIERQAKVLKTMMDNPRLFYNLEPIEGAIEAVKELSENYDILFLSTPMWCIPESFTDKRLWLGKHFGDWAEDRLILTKRKNLNVGDYLIDDRLVNGAGEFLGKHIHYGTEGFANWEEVMETFRFLVVN